MFRINCLKILRCSYVAGFLFSAALIDQSSWANGGITAGGGGSLPTNPVSPAKVEEVLSSARPVLLLYFNKLSRSEELKGSLYERLFEGAETIFSVIEKNHIYRQKQEACIGPDGNSYDGAAPGPEANSICISVERLAQKLNQDNVITQTLALVAHEYSHLVGLNEAEAEELQQQVVESLREQAPATPTQILQKALEAFRGFNHWLLMIQPKLETGSIEELHGLVDGITWQVDYLAPANSTFSEFNSVSGHVFSEEMTRLALIERQLGSLALPTPEARRAATEYYKHLFRGDTVVDFLTVQLRQTDPIEAPQGPYISPSLNLGVANYHKIVFENRLDRDLLAKELKLFAKWVTDQWQYFRKINALK